MFDSGLTDFKVTKADFGRDVMRLLAESLRARGLRIGWYYSPRDWHHHDYLPKLPFDEPNQDADIQHYFQQYLKGQVEELIASYGPVSLLWFDGSDHPPEVAGTDDLVRHIREMAPSILINDRVGKDGYLCDFGIHEGNIPGSRDPRPWETCLTINRNWGYDQLDHRWASVKEIIHKTIDVVSKGGNMLLNIGPDAHGRIPEPAAQRLESLGNWLEVNGEAIYATVPYRHSANKHIRYTRRGETFYAILLERPGQHLVLPEFTMKAGGLVRLLGGGILGWWNTDGGICVDVSDPLPDGVAWTLAFEGIGEPLAP